MSRAPVLLVLLLAALAPAAAAAARFATFTHEAFTLRLPGGWFVAQWKPAPNGRRAVPMKKPARARSERVVLLADSRGNYLTVFVDHANDGAFDAVWNVRPGPDGATVEVSTEGKPCERGSASPAQGPCSQGNGTFELSTLPAVRLKGHAFLFEFGNAQREKKPDLELLRWLLQNFRAR